jgi:outer membrane protein assembly factor BamB
MRPFVALILCGTLSAAPIEVKAPAPVVVWSKDCKQAVDTIWSVDGLKFVLVRSDTTLELMDSRDGRVVWTKTFSSARQAVWLPPLNLLLVPDRGHTVVIEAVSGNQTEWPGELKSQGFLAGMNAIIGHTGGKRLFLAGDDLKLRWETTLKDKVDTVLSYSAIPESGLCLVLARKSGLGVVIALELATGAVRWERPLTAEVGNAVADSYIVPVLKDGYVYLELHGLTKLELKNGKVEWFAPYNTTENYGSSTYLTEYNPPLMFVGDDVITGAKGRIRRIDLKTGKVKWRSKDYDLTPQMFLQGNSVVAVTGGKFGSVSYRATWLGMLVGALGAFGGVAGILVAGAISQSMLVQRWAPSRSIADAIEDRDLVTTIDTVFKRGYPGIVVVDATDGKEITWIRGESGGFAGLGFGELEMIVGDTGGIWRFEPAAPGAPQADRLPIEWEGKHKKTHWLARLADGDVVAVNADAGDSAVMQRLKPVGKTLTRVWSTPFPDAATWPEVLGMDADNAYAVSYYQMTAIELKSGKPVLSVPLTDRGWSLYPRQRALVYYSQESKKSRKLTFCRFGTPEAPAAAARD